MFERYVLFNTVDPVNFSVNLFNFAIFAIVNFSRKLNT